MMELGLLAIKGIEIAHIEAFRRSIIPVAKKLRPEALCRSYHSLGRYRYPSMISLKPGKEPDR
jgi:hypothetical protein